MFKKLNDFIYLAFKPRYWCNFRNLVTFTKKFTNIYCLILLEVCPP